MEQLELDLEAEARDYVVQKERDFHFILRDFHDLVEHWDVETVMEYMWQNFNSTYDRVVDYANIPATNSVKWSTKQNPENYDLETHKDDQC